MKTPRHSLPLAPSRIPAFPSRAPARHALALAFALTLLAAGSASAQMLVNVDFGVGAASAKTGFAGTGQRTNDFWNLYAHYAPKYLPGMPLVADGALDKLKLADGSETKISLSVSNAPGVWGNATGDAMYDGYIFPLNGSNLTVTVRNLDPGNYHFFLYGHADPDVTGEQNSVFTLFSGTNLLGPQSVLGSAGWRATSPMQERQQFVVFRDVPVLAGVPVRLEVAPGANGVAVLNGLQIFSRGTSPPKLPVALVAKAAAVSTNLFFHEVTYTGKISETEARFGVHLRVETFTTNEISAPLFGGDVAVLAPALPEGLRIVNSARQFRLVSTAPGVYELEFDVIAKITRQEPWNHIAFTGPAAAISRVTAHSTVAGVDLQLTSGTPALDEPGKPPRAVGTVSGFLGADRALALRWQGKTVEVARKSLVTVDTQARAHLTPTVIKYTTELHYEVVQGSVPRLAIALPASQTITKIDGGSLVRDWQVKPDGARQSLTIEFIKPLEKNAEIKIFSEQLLDAATASLLPPEPLGADRESGSFTVSAEEMLVEVDTVTGLRQVNATGGALAAYRFYGRPFALSVKVKRLEPVLNAADRVTVRLEETRLLVSHALTLTVERAGIYGVDLVTQTNFAVADVRGEGVEDWKITDGKLRVNFKSQVLGARRLEVQLEQPHKTFPARLDVAPLRVTGAVKETARVGAAAAQGIRLKTADLTGLREVPVNLIGPAADEVLGYLADQPDWKLALVPERLPARVLAEVFNLITMGDGQVGGSATIRYGIINQGVQQFRVKLPAHWKNVEFTGPNIRRKEAQTNIWTISLQDKVWGGYTLVVTYDHQFDPHHATLDAAGAHVLDAERETGFVAITTAASLKLEPKPIAEPLRQIDPTELTETDRALITRPVLLAYRYTGGEFALALETTRHEQAPVLAAVADHTQLTSVLTEAGEMLTQASFMVKNNDKQFQSFKLPAGATLWGVYVNGEPVKAEGNDGWTLVSLPRGANRDEAFSVDLVYAQTFKSLKKVLPSRLQLEAPGTDVPNTYAEWKLYAPVTQRLSGFDGTMSAARGMTYGLRDAWRQFVGYYVEVWNNGAWAILLILAFAALILAAISSTLRHGWRGGLKIFAAVGVLGVIAVMMLPSLGKQPAAKKRELINFSSGGLGGRAMVDVSNEEVEVAAASANQPKSPPPMPTIPAPVMAGKPASEAPRRPMSGPAPFEQARKQLEEAPRDLNQLGDLRARAGEQAEKLGRGDGSGVTVNRSGGGGGAVALQTDGMAVVGGTFSTFNGAERQRAARLNVDGTVDGWPQSLAFTGIGGSAGVPSVNYTTVSGTAISDKDFLPTATGIRSIRIDIPKTGQSFNFTKVLNLGKEPLAVQLTVMRTRVFAVVQMLLQLAAFLVGLGVCWQQWTSADRHSLKFAVGAALALGAVVSLFLALRALHVVLIAATGLAALVLLVLLFRRLLPKRQPRTPDDSEPPASAPGNDAPPTPPATPAPAAPAAPVTTPIVVALALLLSPASGSAQALDSVPYRASAAPAAANPKVTITSASYAGRVGEKVAQFEVTFQITSTATNQTLPLFGDDVAVQSFTVDHNARLVREGGGVGVWLPGKGDFTLELKLVARLGGDVARRLLGFGIAPALASTFTAELDEPDADVEFPSAVSFKRTTQGKQTRVEAVLGATDRVELQWTPRVKRVADMEATIFCDNNVLITIGGGVIRTHAQLEYHISQGELRQAKVRLPAGHRLLRVSATGIRTWELFSEGATEVVVVDVTKGVANEWKLSIETEKPLPALPAALKLEVPHAADVKRESGLVAVRGSDELSLFVDGAPTLQRIDNAEFSRRSAFPATELVSAYRFLKPGFALAVRAEPVTPLVEVSLRNHFFIAAESLRLTGVVEYEVKRAGVFGFKIVLPPGLRLESVSCTSDSGDKLAQWTERTENGVRVLDLALKERVLGRVWAQAHLATNYAAPPRSLPLAGVHPQGVQKISGYVSVNAEPGISVKTDTFDGLTEVPAASLLTAFRAVEPVAANAPAQQFVGQGGNTGAMRAVRNQPYTLGQTPSLGFKLITAEPAPLAAWRLAVATEPMEAWVRAEVVNVISLSETLLSGRALVRYDIQNAPVKDFSIRVPAGVTNVEVTGANIRRRDATNSVWRVELQNKVRGTFTLTVTWESPRDAKTNALDFAGAQAVGVERETGFIAVLAKAPLQVAEKSATEELVKIDARELPDWAGVSAISGRAGAESAVLTFRYLRPGFRLGLDVRRYDEASVLQALVDQVTLTTVVADDGQMMTEMKLAVRNNGKQHLQIVLPPGAKIWSAFVAGQPVRPGQNAGRLMLPLERSGADEAAVPVEIVFVGTNKFPRSHGEVNLLSPSLDVPFKNARWDLYLPPDYEYRDFDGSMTHEGEAAAALASTYTLADYSRQELNKRVASRSEVSSFLSNARVELQRGNLKGVNDNYKSAAVNSYRDEATKKEMKALEMDFNRVQSSNLIQGQQKYLARNGEFLASDAGVLQQQAQQAAQPAQLDYDEKVAEQQWGKLQQAQELVVTTVQPLRVNLPTRGLRHSFTQVLQTSGGKAMTIKFNAGNTTRPSWFKIILLAGGAFLALWLVVALLPERRRA